MKEKNHISLIIIMIALSLFSSYHMYYYFLDKSGNELVKSYYVDNIDLEETNNIVKHLNNEEKEEYLGILKIPKIKLKEGFYNIGSQNNNINKSVTILKESILPDNNGSIIFLTAHSGSGFLAFFKDLNKLDINDIIYLDILNKSYDYIIDNIYELDKTGKITINHNPNEDYLVLTTCSNNKDKQLVIISKMIKKVNIE